MLALRSSRKAMALPGIVAALFACGFSAGCTTPIELDIPSGYEPRLVVDSRFTPDSVWAVGLQQSVPYADYVSPDAYLVTEAVVVVEGEDGFREELVHVGEGDFRSAVGSRPAREIRYTLTAHAPDLPSVRASSIVPPVDAAFVGIEEVTPAMDEENGVYVIRLNLHDAPGPHYYSIRLDMLDLVCYNDRGYLTTSNHPDSGTEYRGNVLFTSDLSSMREYISQVEDPSEPFIASEPFYFGAYFSDDLFEGKMLEIALEATSENPVALTPHFRIIVESWSDALWRYEESSERYDGNYGLFSERPISLHSNVEDGLGVFGGWSNVALFVDAEGNTWTEEDLKVGSSHVQSCEEEAEDTG